MATSSRGEGQTRQVIERTGWNLREEAELRPHYKDCPTPSQKFCYDECYNLEL